MRLTELEELILDLSGEYLVGDLATIQFDHDRVWRLAKKSLVYYQKYKPVIKTLHLTAQKSKHTFPDGEIPEWISSAVPVGVPIIPGISTGIGKPTSVVNFVWRYEKPDLYLSESTAVKAVAVFNYPYDVALDADGKVEDVDMPDIDEADDKFIDLTLAHFLISLGRSRRAFTLTDLPIVMDGADLISEGNELLSSAKDSLGERSKWYLSVPI